MKSDSTKDIDRVLSRYNQDVKRHMSALSEEFQGRVQGIAEQYGDIQKTLKSHTTLLESHTEMIGRLAVDVEVVKTNVEFLKGGMKKKVDYDEFLALERRLSLVESKIKR